MVQPHSLLDMLMHTLRAMQRRLTRQRWHVAMTVSMLALGIGASTTMVSFLYQVLVQPTGIQSPDRLVEIFEDTPPWLARKGVTLLGGLPFAGMEAQRAHNPTLARVALAASRPLGLRVANEEARRVATAFVSAGYFEMLGVPIPMGRAFGVQDEKPGDPIAVISHRLWKRAFGGDREVLGRGFLLNGRPCEIVGVAPKGFAGHELATRTDVWVSWGAQAALNVEVAKDGTVLGRLKAGTALASAEAATAAVGDRLIAGLPGEEREKTGRHRVRRFDLNRQALLADLLPHPWLLLAAPLLMLLLACANVANLQLAEFEERRREFASRSAIGASRADLVRQVLCENLALGLAACAAGLAVAYPMMNLLQRVPTERMAEARLEVVLQPWAVAFALAATWLVVLVMGLGPALRASRASVADVLKGSAGQVLAAGRSKDVLVAVQVGLALLLVTAGMLVARSLDRARGEDFGLRPAGVVGMRLQLNETASDARVTAETLRRLLDRARALPGVQAASVSAGFPLENAVLTFVRGHDDIVVPATLVGADHFATLGVTVISGREFGASDVEPGAGAVVVNAAAARAYWPGENPVGRRLGSREVVGVVANHAAITGISLHKPFAFVPMSAQVGSWPCLLVRTQGRPESLLQALRRIAREVDPSAPVLRVSTLADHLDGLHHHLRVATWLLGLCGLASLALAAMGIHSLLAVRVARQRREIGLRLAIGAGRRAVVGLVVVRTLVGVLGGLGAGGVGAYVLGRTVRGLVAEAAPLHIGTLLLSTALLAVVAVLAAAAPAWRAARIDPARALQGE